MGIENYKTNQSLALYRNFCKIFAGVLVLLITLYNTASAQLGPDLVIQGQFHIQSNAFLYVQGDVSMQTVNGQLTHAGTLDVEGNMGKDASSQFIAEPSGLVVFRNDSVNTDKPQYITGDFTAANAFEKVEIDNRAADPGLHLADNNLEIRSMINFTNGNLVTVPPPGEGFPAGNFELILSDNEPGAITGDISNFFIAGKLKQAVQPGRTYYLPIGPADELLAGQPVQLTINSGPNALLDLEFTRSSFTPIGTPAFCDSDEVAAYSPSGNVNMDCVTGQWEINSPVTGFNYDVEFFPGNDLVGGCNFLMHWLAKDGVLTSGCPQPGYAAYNLNDFSIFDIPGITQPVLALDLLSFDAVPVQNLIELKWHTQSEVDFDGFELEKSTDGENFEALTWISGKGNETTPANYSFQDNNVQKNKIYYYRLKLVDLDESYKYSEVRTAVLANFENFSEARVYPNPIDPVNQSLTYVALFTGEITLRLFNSVGQLVFEHQANANEGFNTIKLPNLPTGPYHLLLQDETYTRRGTVIISH